MPPIHLPKLAKPFVINDQLDEELKRLCSQLDQLFQGSSDLSLSRGFFPMEDKGHIVEHPSLPGWIIKGPRDPLHEDAKHFEFDSHLYRVERSLQIQQILRKYHFTELVFPKKYLYRAADGKWLVIAEKLELDQTVTCDLQKEKTKTYQPLTVKQAHELATISFEGRLEDLSVSNINYLRNGKVAIVDTEAVSRKILRNFNKYFIYKFCLGIKSTLIFTSSMANCERLYLLCPPEARKEVRRVQNKYLWKHLVEIFLFAGVPLLASMAFVYITVSNLSYLFLVVALLNVSSGIYASYLTLSNYIDIKRTSEA